MKFHFLSSNNPDAKNTEKKLTELFGSLEFDLQLIKIEKLKVVEELKNVSEATDKMALNLQEKYGEGNVNVETGEFIKR